MVTLAANALLVDLPSLERVGAGTIAPTTQILDRDGRLLYEIMDPRSGRQTPLPLEEIPLYLRQATIATEDASFYTNPGVDARAILRAIWINLRGGEVLAGGSTITQQLARNLLLSPEERSQRTLVRKLRESILAWRLSRAFTKDEILALYLNTTYYGNLAYGVEAAAQAIFGKRARDLDLAECALIAGLPQAPSLYNPLIDPEAAHKRQTVVLDLMVKTGYITPEQAAQAKQEKLSFAATPFPIRAPHFVMYVWDLLKHRYGEEMIYKRGLRVTTTLDLDMQERAQEIVRYRLSLLNEPKPGAPQHNVTDAALVALDPQSGEILVMLGSPDYFDPKIDGAVNCTLMPRQPGSSIKPVTYAAAFSEDYAPATVLMDVRTAFTTQEGVAYVPINYDLKYHGPTSLRQALGSSYNLIAVKVLDHIGLEKMISLAHALGLSTLDDRGKFGLALTLGGGEVRLLELTAAYSAFANGGRRVDPVAILRVEDSAGRLIDAWQPAPGEPVLDERVAYLITHVLSDDTARIPAFGEGSVLKLSRPAAVKTGTTNDWRDNWTVGYTPDLAVGVWVGNADNSPMHNVSGISGAAPIWHDFMEEVLKGTPVREFTEPAGIAHVEVCAESGLRPGPLCTRRRTEIFIAGKEPTRECDAHQLVALDARTGEVAGPDTPPEHIIWRIFTILPPEAQEWARETGFPQPHVAMTAPEASAQKGAREEGIILTDPYAFSVYRLMPDLPPADQRILVAARPTTSTRIARMTFYVDNQAIAEVTTPPYSTFWPLALGKHAIHAVATDIAGQQLESPRVFIEVQPY
ncbi:MAG: PBP1A family penicillin-binding protein [Chloroflexi bacterium]|nr:PBP1A family penicillin-binding protein [Chloroflexota bacterium]